MPTTTRTFKLDAACAEAVDLAREVAEATAGPMGVGEHRGVEAEGDRVVSHWFDCTHPAYRGWRWSVTLARASRARTVTVDEVVLLPGDGALLAPDWVPWAERVQPGDVTAGSGDAQRRATIRGSSRDTPAASRPPITIRRS